MKRFFRMYVISKIVSLMLTGTAMGQTPKIDLFAHAIARAEGFGVPKAIPTTCHNPGDVKVVRGWQYPGQVGVCKGGHVRFRNDTYGWAALRHQVEKMTDGTSRVYRPSMTFREVARLYAGNSKPWVRIITTMLEVTPDESICFYFGSDRTNLVTELEGLWDFNVAAGITPSDAVTVANASVAHIGM